MQGPRSYRIWYSTKSGYVNAHCSADKTKCLTFGGKSQSSNKNGESAMWWKLVGRQILDNYKKLRWRVRENKMKPWKCHVLTTCTGKQFVNTADSYDIYIVPETDMGPELSTVAADQNFAWICKQLLDQIGSVLFFRTIWSGTMWISKRAHYCQSLMMWSLGSGAFSRDFTINLSPQCSAHMEAVKSVTEIFIGEKKKMDK